MGRLQQALFTFIAALELSGCLLFTDPINKAPVVKSIAGPLSPFRGDTATYSADVSDDQDGPENIDLKWAQFQPDGNGSCLYATAPTVWISTTAKPASLDVPYIVAIQTLDVVCVCVQAIDHNGATTQFCDRVTPVNPKPVATLSDVSLPPGQTTHPLCSNVHVFGASPTSPAGDKLEFDWTGRDPAGNDLQIARCPGSASDADQCFAASSPGQYTVSLTITDSTTAADGTVTTTTSDPSTLAVTVDVDRPACIQATTPDVNAQTILVSRNQPNQPPRILSVTNVADDCDSYPSPSSGLQFVWSVFDPTQPNPSWVPQTNPSAASFTISQDLFPNVRPGDTVQVRVEVRDRTTQACYLGQKLAGPLCSQDTPTCYTSEAAGCSSQDASDNPTCVRWTTWNVQFQP